MVGAFREEEESWEEKEMKKEGVAAAVDGKEARVGEGEALGCSLYRSRWGAPVGGDGEEWRRKSVLRGRRQRRGGVTGLGLKERREGEGKER